MFFWVSEVIFVFCKVEFKVFKIKYYKVALWLWGEFSGVFLLRIIIVVGGRDYYWVYCYYYLVWDKNGLEFRYYTEY